MTDDYEQYRCSMETWAEQAKVAGVSAPTAQAAVVDEAFSRAMSLAQAELTSNILGMIHAQTPGFFEELVIDLLLAMGYGGRRRDLAARLGRTGDGGVDGVVAQDELGLDLIYVQAKRLKPGTVVPVEAVRDFAGSLDAHHASKGVFVATVNFSSHARQFCAQVSRRVVLVDGPKLADLMIRHNVGVRVRHSYQVKRVDMDYFTAAPAARAWTGAGLVNPSTGR